MSANDRPVAVITGASAGIGGATARALAALGYEVLLGARRFDRITALAEELNGRALPLDVTREESVDAFARQVERVRVLVNNAGLSRGLDPLATAKESHWREMWETNVMGVMRVTRALLPALRAGARSDAPAHVVTLGSVAGVEVYPGGAGYTASKHGVHAIAKTLRLELHGEPVRLTEILPGLVETEFSLVRFDGDAEKAGKPYAGITPLSAADIADAIVWAVSRPPHVNIDEIHLKPVAQATAALVRRKS